MIALALSVQAAGTAGPPVIATMSGPPPEAVAMVAIVFGALAMVGVPIARAFARRIEGGTAAPATLSTDLSDRLDRIERAVEAVALEVERISEGQRFVTKLMAERAGPENPALTAGTKDR